MVYFSALSLIFSCLLWQQANGQFEGDLRLVGSFIGSSSGRLEIYHDFQWGTVCDDGFGSTDADVACRQLGYSRASSHGSVGSLGFSPASSSTPTWLDEVFCFGTESRLAFCSHNGYGIEDCSHFEDVALICTNSVVGTSGFINVVGIGIGVSVGVVVLIIIVVIVCIVCCVACAAAGSSRPRRTRVVQPPAPATSNVVTYTTTQASTAYPMQQPYTAAPQQPPAAYSVQPDPTKEPTNPEFSSAGAPPAYNVATAYPPQASTYPPTDPNTGYPPTDPNAGYPPTDPNPGYPPTDYNAGYPPTDSNSGYPTTDLGTGYPSTNPNTTGYP